MYPDYATAKAVAGSINNSMVYDFYGESIGNYDVADASFQNYYNEQAILAYNQQPDSWPEPQMVDQLPGGGFDESGFEQFANDQADFAFNQQSDVPFPEEETIPPPPGTSDRSHPERRSGECLQRTTEHRRLYRSRIVRRVAILLRPTLRRRRGGSGNSGREPSLQCTVRCGVAEPQIVENLDGIHQPLRVDSRRATEAC